LFSDYPVEATAIPRVGGLLDPNFELIGGMRPSMVLALSEFRERTAYLGHLGLDVSVFEHRHISGILSSLEELGTTCGVEERAHQVLEGLRREMASLRQRYSRGPQVRVMVVVGETSSDGKMKSFYLSGSDGYYGDVLALVGAKNVVESPTVASPTVSGEGVISLNPDVILHILYPSRDAEQRRAETLRLWSKLGTVPAVRDKRVYVFDQDFASVPGPRFIKLARAFASAIYGAKD
ncbi:MAG: ABC transporter substrate-binding protein, partial [Oligoflexia bacterium]|nr:ABC transporter substrate-binding protein [Oligoflexia bacterium]